MSNGEVECGRLRKVERLPRPRQRGKLAPRGRFQVEHWRGGKRIAVYDVPNAIVNEGKNQLLNVQFNSATAITAWYIGLIDGSGTPVLAATDIYAHIGNGNGWNENTGYSNGTASNGPSGPRPASP